MSAVFKLALILTLLQAMTMSSATDANGMDVIMTDTVFYGLYATPPSPPPPSPPPLPPPPPSPPPP
eukprot:CAMPEP_0114298882 /NCGR_PEP_ID=MMETSP0059-20121206/12663_1 /TAXON_ID=36894 /ORGANISM="Pyramimonas parkeae, Strain CCMP726" /LENGTH=65 /DNA_ID=CAMNT_0001421289 /DNA_START=133 /DNA_END=327 /DNA_ORIENTATION=+